MPPAFQAFAYSGGFRRNFLFNLKELREEQDKKRLCDKRERKLVAGSKGLKVHQRQLIVFRFMIYRRVFAFLIHIKAY